MKFILFLFSFFFLFNLSGCGPSSPTESSQGDYFPPPDSLGGWRTLSEPADVRLVTKMDPLKLDEAFNYVRTTTKNGGLLVVRNGYLIYENYFGKGQRDAAPNLGSCGKSFTSIAVGILMKEYPNLFPDGLDQKIFTPIYLPAKAFPLSDSRMETIRLGQLLSFSAGIRGNNPVYINGVASKIDTVGPDGWYGLTDEFALGIEEGTMNDVPFSTKTLWCAPGEGYSYSTASIHIASVMLRHITGKELEKYIETQLAQPLGWGQWGFGYKYAKRVTHTPGGGGIALRSTDMLRFCYLLLRGGKWNGEQVVPEDFIRAATKKSPYNPHFPYSLQFDVNSGKGIPELPEDAYWKIGSGGHCFYVVPSLDMIVWKMGGRDGQYSSDDTGISEPAPLPDVIQPLTPDEPLTDKVYTKTLEMVIQAALEE